ncbi:subtilisin family serine protease [Paenibacillus forsythiae]|uniref:Subtilisin family serine protease n=1 Tax=Paenibacillus forsythiae TaxID=365616 RepID=A0ABU3H6U1_9BACL|nr:S8 family peptidase [Paenibacillus forsythiae]MDT3426536.1 subtilisin family serine protease [Paenibacillus forsythiae]
MSRKNIAIAGLLTAAFASVLVLGITSRPGTGLNGRQPGYVRPAQEKSLKKTALIQDVKATERLSRIDAGRDLRAMLAGTAGKSSRDVALYAEKLQHSHGHIAMLMWIDFASEKIKTFKSIPPEGTREQQQRLRQYLSAAKSAVKKYQSYESPSFAVGTRKYFIMGQRSRDGQLGVVALIDQTLLSRVAEHQRKNLRLIPYPKEGKFRIESVHADTLRDMTVKTGHDNENASHYYENEIVVRFREGHLKSGQIQAISADIRCGAPRKLGYAYIFRSSDRSYTQLKTYFVSKWHPLYTEPHYVYLTNDSTDENAAAVITPNDLLYPDYQWNLPAIETGRGWNLSKGNSKITIAVVDTGVQADHPDLHGQLLPGYNAITSGAKPDDDVGHGTHVCGIIGALVNNSEGVAGISWYNKILPVKALDNSGAGTTYSVSEGIIWAADHGAKVINLSLGNYADSQFLHDAVKYAYDKDVVLVSASGNDNTERPGYPAAYPEVLAVAATNASGERASFSNYGDYIDVAAPGESIASTYPGSQYAALSGTSMASPHVAALAGLVRSLNPDLTNKEVMDLMTRNTVDLGSPGHDKYYGSGQVDIYKTLQAASGGEVPIELWPQHVRRKINLLERTLNTR